MDSAIVCSLAHRDLPNALVQPGTLLLARPAYTLINELEINLNGLLNTDPPARIQHLEILIQGWEFGKQRLVPFSCKLVRGLVLNGNHYFNHKHQRIGKFLRTHPSGLWGETLGDSGTTIDAALNRLAKSEGLTHDDVERRMVAAVRDRSHEAATVSASSVAVQLDSCRREGQGQFSYYPAVRLEQGYPFLSPWVMTPRMICSPSLAPSSYSQRSKCGQYLCGGFTDGNTGLDVITRLPRRDGMPSGGGMLSFKPHPRPTLPL
jgi:hypothetical protein